MGPAKTEIDLEIAGAPRCEKANRGDVKAEGSASAIWDFDRFSRSPAASTLYAGFETDIRLNMQ
jgi:hypothetical protein